MLQYCMIETSNNVLEICETMMATKLKDAPAHRVSILIVYTVYCNIYCHFFQETVYTAKINIFNYKEYTLYTLTIYTVYCDLTTSQPYIHQHILRPPHAPETALEPEARSRARS